MFRREAWTLRRAKYLTPQQVVGELLPAAKRLPDPRVWFLLYLSVNLGARISEVLELRGRDVNPSEPIVSIKTLKRRKPHVRELLLPDDVMAVIRNWMAEHETKPDDWLFPSPYGTGSHVTRQWAYQQFTRAALSAGVKTWGQPGKTRGNGIHSLRHANAIAWMERLGKIPGLSALNILLQVADRLGHAGAQTTLVYVHPSQERESVSAVGAIV